MTVFLEETLAGSLIVIIHGNYDIAIFSGILFTNDNLVAV